MRKVFILDFEATSVDPLTTRPIEVAVSSYDIEAKIATPVYHAVMHDSDYPVIKQEILDLTHIPLEEIQNGQKPRDCFQCLHDLFQPSTAGKATIVIGHNVTNYDKPLFDAEAKRHAITMPPIVWIDTLRDLQGDFRCRILSHLVLDHGFTVDPTNLHRAAADVAIVATLLSKYSVPELYKRAIAPRVYVIADVSFADKEKAKKKGFRWESPEGDSGPRFPKKWVRSVIEPDLVAVRGGCDFPTNVVTCNV